MGFRLTLSHVIFSLVLAVSFSAIAFADTIRLKDGSIIKGHIASFSNGKFVIEIGEGSRLRQLTFEVNEIESIIFDPSAAQTTKPDSVPASYTKPDQKLPAPPQVIVTDTMGKTGTVQSQPQGQTKSQSPTSSQPRPSASGSIAAPIAWSTKVLADNTSNGWTNSGWVVKKGQRIRITGDGTVSLGKGQNCEPSGNAELEDDQKLMKNVPTGALIAVIGDDNNDFIYIGANREFTATRDGTLFLGINEGDLNDNSGSFNVKIEILPDGGKSGN